jgi:hypothetical protein
MCSKLEYLHTIAHGMKSFKIIKNNLLNYFSFTFHENNYTETREEELIHRVVDFIIFKLYKNINISYYFYRPSLCCIFV